MPLSERLQGMVTRVAERSQQLGAFDQFDRDLRVKDDRDRFVVEAARDAAVRELTEALEELEPLADYGFMAQLEREMDV